MENNIKPTDEEIEIWSEGNSYLKELLLSCRENDVTSYFCCAGHEEQSENNEKNAYIFVEYSKRTKEQIYRVINSIKNDTYVKIAFTKKLDKKGFIVYMSNIVDEKNNDNIMQKMSKALDKKRIQGNWKEEFNKLDNKYKEFIKFEENLDEKCETYTIEYAKRILDSDITIDHTYFKEKNIDDKKVFTRLDLSQNELISKIFRKEEIDENEIGFKFECMNNEFHNMFEKEEKQKRTISQKIAQILSKNTFISKNNLIKKFVNKQLNVLPEASIRKTDEEVERDEYYEVLENLAGDDVVNICFKKEKGKRSIDVSFMDGTSKTINNFTKLFDKYKEKDDLNYISKGLLQVEKNLNENASEYELEYENFDDESYLFIKDISLNDKKLDPARVFTDKLGFEKVKNNTIYYIELFGEENKIEELEFVSNQLGMYFKNNKGKRQDFLKGLELKQESKLRRDNNIKREEHNNFERN